MNLLEIKGLTKSINSFSVLKNINLNVKKKEIMGLVGENGAGKTTLMKCICGLNKINTGTICFEGKANRIGVLIEYPSLYSHMSSIENLTFFGKAFGILDLEKRINELIILVGLEKAKNKKVSEYSLGMKQRLGLAISLINDPQILILDEPTNGLDPNGIIEFRKILVFLVKKKKISVIISSHLLAELEVLADRICFLKEGKVIDIKNKDSITTNFHSKIIVETKQVKKTREVIQKHLSIVGTIISSSKIEFEKENLTFDKLIEVLITNKITIENIYKKESTLEDYYLQMEDENQ